jgi:hypothetical protein
VAGGKKKVAGKPLWDTTKFAIGKWFSQTIYLVVKNINANQITVEN